jgi:hypothetical protein
MEPAHEGLPVLDFPPPGPLPAPNGDLVIRPSPRRAPIELPRECGGVCAPDPEVTSPTTEPEESTDPEIDEEEAIEGGPPGGAPP